MGFVSKKFIWCGFKTFEDLFYGFAARAGRWQNKIDPKSWSVSDLVRCLAT